MIGLIISQIIRGYGTRGLTLEFWGDECSFSGLGVDAILGNGRGVQMQNFAQLLQGSEMTAGCHYRNWVLFI